MADTIYEYIKNNFNIEIKNYIFKRDYIKEPLKSFKDSSKNEKPFLEDMIFLYITLNLTSTDLGLIFNKGKDWGSTFCRKHNIIKTKQQKQQSQENRYLRLYGKKNYFSGKDGYKNAMKHFKEKYGYDNPAACPKIKKKIEETLINKYNIKNPRHIQHLLESYKNEDFIKTMNHKRYLTRKLNDTLGKSISKEEKNIYTILKIKYPLIQSQYYSEKYPWKCDFYIPEIDTYIEYQGYWKHGKEPFVGTEKQLEKVKLWENKSLKHPSYMDAIKCWSITDPLKRKTAKENNLIWLEFFNLEQFMTWFNQL